MNFAQSVKTCFKKYATFSGRATRSEFWYFLLFVSLLKVASNLVVMAMVGDFSRIPSIIVALATFFPLLAVSVRRLHDINRSAWWIAAFWFLLVILYINMIYQFNHTILGIITLFIIIYPIIMIVFYCKKGTIGDNRYGKDPLAESGTRIEEKHS